MQADELDEEEVEAVVQEVLDDEEAVEGVRRRIVGTTVRDLGRGAIELRGSSRNDD